MVLGDCCVVLLNLKLDMDVFRLHMVLAYLHARYSINVFFRWKVLKKV